MRVAAPIHMRLAWVALLFNLTACVFDAPLPEGDTRLLRDPVSGRCMRIPGCDAGGMACADGDWDDWESCDEATPCTGDLECGDGSHCSTRDGECGPPPGCDPASGEICPRVCGGVCVADVPLPPTCLVDSDCDDGFRCAYVATICFPPPGCEMGEACPAVCGGLCVPDGPSSCYAVTEEARCVARADCEPIYAGSDCHCDAQGCACDTYSFAQCRPRSP